MVTLQEPIVFEDLLSRLPEPIIEDILLRLPVKFLMRLRCASKSWFCFVTGKNFANLHLKQTALSSRILLCSENGEIKSVDYDFGDCRTPKFPVDIDLGSFEIMASCNGLVILGSFEPESEFMYLWNPSTAVYKKLAPFPESQRFRKKDMDGFGFVYDESSDDYKFVVFYRDSNVVQELRACIYSHKSSSWKIITDLGKLSATRFSHNGVFVDGALHWLLVENKIRVFELGSEKVKEVALPNTEILRIGYFVVDLVSRQGRLCCIVNYRRLWRIYEHGPNGCWRELTLNLPIEFHFQGWAICCTQNVEMIFSTYSHTLVKLDSNGNTIVRSSSSYSDCRPLLVYDESLISPNEENV